MVYGIQPGKAKYSLTAQNDSVGLTYRSVGGSERTIGAITMPATREITNAEDIIDSRDIIERINELSEDDSRTAEETEELAALQTLAEEASGYAPDWEYGETLIRDSYFEDYARQLAEDIGAVKDDATWPNNCIDWARATRELQSDYTAVDFAGVTYWIR